MCILFVSESMKHLTRTCVVAMGTPYLIALHFESGAWHFLLARIEVLWSPHSADYVTLHCQAPNAVGGLSARSWCFPQNLRARQHQHLSLWQRKQKLRKRVDPARQKKPSEAITPQKRKTVRNLAWGSCQERYHWHVPYCGLSGHRTTFFEGWILPAVAVGLFGHRLCIGHKNAMNVHEYVRAHTQAKAQQNHVRKVCS